MTPQALEALLAENRRRQAALAGEPYDPLRGIGCCGPRTAVDGSRVPDALLARVPRYAQLPPRERERERLRDDFEFWAARCATVRDKVTSRSVPFVLNGPQRRLLAVMEGQRLAGRPVRVILLKARQWGGSTLVQLYMAWMQLTRHTGWNSFICGHRHQSARAVKRIYNHLLRHYPAELTDDGRPWRMGTLEGSRNVGQLEQRDCLVVTGSSLSEDAVRGYDLSMAHLTEVAFWAESERHSPEDVVRSVSGTVALQPDTVLVMESTANGMGNFFHTEWLRARAGESDKTPVFVPWHEIAIYTLPVNDAAALWESLDDYERDLWQAGRTLEQINWYHHKRREYTSRSQMQAEYPGNDVEAFARTGHNVFDLTQLSRLRESCRPPLDTGDIEADYKSVRHVHFVPQRGGLLHIWRHPEGDSRAVAWRYVVSCDVGGRGDKADYSVIAVWDRHDGRTSRPEIVAQWRGHLDHDLMAWKAAQIATYYHNALLVIESNTLETEQGRLDAGEYILNEISRHYGHLYRRSSRREGFQTNRRTKREAVYRLMSAVRDLTYVERSHDAVDEMSWFEQQGDGRFGAVKGRHDDIVMTRAIGLTVLARLAPVTAPAPPAESLTICF